MKAILFFIVLISTSWLAYALDPMSAYEAYDITFPLAREQCQCDDLILLELYAEVNQDGKVSHQGNNGWTVSYYSQILNKVYPVVYYGGTYRALDAQDPLGNSEIIAMGWKDSPEILPIALNLRDGFLRDALANNPELVIDMELLKDHVFGTTWRTRVGDSVVMLNAYSAEFVYAYFDPLDSKTVSWQEIKAGY